MAKSILQIDSVTNGLEKFTGETGSGDIVRATSPTLVTPNVGVATVTSVNKVAITAPAASATLTIANTKTLTVNNTLTLAGTDGSTLTIGSGGALVYTSNNISALATSTSAQFLAACTDETGTGLLVFNNAPTFITPVLGACTLTTANGLTINATTGVLTIANGSTLATSGAFALTLTSTAATNVTLPLTGTLSTLAGAEILTNKTLTLPIISSSLSLGTDIIGVAGVAHTFKSADATGATASNNITFASGDTASAASGITTITTGSVSTLGNSGALILQSGQSNISGNSGAASMITGTAVLGNSGTASIASGSVTTGNSGDGTIATGNAAAGASGNVVLTTGTASTIRGVIFQRAASVSKHQPAPATMTGAATITVAQIINGIIEGTPTTGATRAYTLPTGVDLANALPVSFTTSDSIDFTIINLQATATTDTITLTASVGITIVGKPIIDSANAAAVYPSSGTFRLRMSAAATFVCYRIS